PWTPAPVTKSTETNVKVIGYSFAEGSISYEFEITDENNSPINGLLNVQAKVAALTDKGFITNPDEGPADNVHVGGAVTQATAGAELTALADGHYQFKVPMKGVNPATEGIVWLRVGGNDGIATSKPLVVNKPEGTHSTTTDSCYSCHIDYSTSPRRHRAYVATGMDSEVTFVEGCLVCHGSVSKGVKNAEGFSTGSYATNTLSKIGHINHQKFTKDFSVMNCTSCHVEAPNNINVAGPGCIDCHNTGGVPGVITPNGGADLRIPHESKAGITERQAIRAKYKVSLSTPVKVADISTKTDHTANDWVGTPPATVPAEEGFCTTLTVKDVDGNIINIKDKSSHKTYNAAKPIVYAGAYLQAYENGSIVGRPGNRTNYYYGYNADGTKNICHSNTNATPVNANYVYSARVTFSTPGWMYYDGKARYQSNGNLRANGYDGAMGVSFTAYSDVVNPTTGAKVSAFGRRSVVNDNSCTTCHNDGTAFHKDGAFDEGGKACIACHDNGMERTSAALGAGFGPMVHSWHWGNGAKVGEVKADGTQAKTANGAGAIEASTSCVACHTKAIDLSKVPNQYIAEPASKMTSPVTANCYACHTSDSAKAHMATNGGEISVPKVADWFKQPTSESCAVCHDTGRSYGIDKYHKFTR
ncbi:multiheme c-type cytochrome, partial [Shewanella putrefaciens]|uniref:multiheme c-type cytochrome n=1 Tax=Shewanella putrefaciens TaxID=24 RepID=UPI003564039F